MKRRLFNMLTGVTLILWLGTNALWLRSHFTQTLISDARNGRLVRVHAKENGVVIAVIRGWPTSEGVSIRSAAVGVPGFGIPVLFTGSTFHRGNVFLGISRDSGSGVANGPAFSGAPPSNVTGWDVVIDWIFLQGLTTILFFPMGARFLQLHHRRRRRILENRCLACGYDLRATPERCPECGTVTTFKHPKISPSSNSRWRN
jgi:hypothetical protein